MRHDVLKGFELKVEATCSVSQKKNHQALSKMEGYEKMPVWETVLNLIQARVLQDLRTLMPMILLQVVTDAWCLHHPTWTFSFCPEPRICLGPKYGWKIS